MQISLEFNYKLCRLLAELTGNPGAPGSPSLPGFPCKRKQKWVIRGELSRAEK